MPIEQAGGVVIQRHGSDVRYLLVTAKDDRQRWVWPKGRIETGESPEDAALREVREEAGVVARVSESIGEIFVRGGDQVRRVHFFVMAHVQDVKTDERRLVGWFAYHEVMARLTTPESQEILTRARSVVEGDL